MPTLNSRANVSNKDPALFIPSVGTISASPGVQPTLSNITNVFARAVQRGADTGMLMLWRVDGMDISMTIVIDAA